MLERPVPHIYLNLPQYIPMVELKLGDRVLVTGVVGQHSTKLVDAKGTVVDFYGGSYDEPCVEFDRDIDTLHGCQGHSKRVNGWYLSLGDEHDNLHTIKVLTKSGKIKKGKTIPKDFCKVLASL